MWLLPNLDALRAKITVRLHYQTPCNTHTLRIATVRHADPFVAGLAVASLQGRPRRTGGEGDIRGTLPFNGNASIEIELSNRMALEKEPRVRRTI